MTKMELVPKKRGPRRKLDDADSPEIIGRRIREARELAGFSSPQLAVHLGISRAGVSAMELGKSGVTIGLLERVARVLQTSVEWLRYGHGNGPRIPRPVMVPEINVEHAGFDPGNLMDYRTTAEWAMPLAEAQRLGLSEKSLVAIRINEAVPPEFRPGDVVAVDTSTQQVTRRGYYAFVMWDRCVISLVNKSGTKVETTIQKQTVPVREDKILGSVVYLCFRNNFALPLEPWNVR